MMEVDVLFLMITLVPAGFASKLSTDPLDLSQLVDVIDVLKKSGFPVVRWVDLGLRLGLLMTTLDTIEKSHTGDIPGCLTECLSKWLSRVDNVDRRGGATWHSLSVSLRSMDENAVVDKLEQEIHRLHSHVNDVYNNQNGKESTIHQRDTKESHRIPPNLGKEKADAVTFEEVFDMLQEGVNIANKLLGESGEILRGDGKGSIKWNIQGTRRAFEWMWICTCYDTRTYITEVHTKYSRDGAMKHCLRALFKKIGNN